MIDETWIEKLYRSWQFLERKKESKQIFNSSKWNDWIFSISLEILFYIKTNRHVSFPLSVPRY
jgi:hypothetical protein